MDRSRRALRAAAATGGERRRGSGLVLTYAATNRAASAHTDLLALTPSAVRCSPSARRPRCRASATPTPARHGPRRSARPARSARCPSARRSSAYRRATDDNEGSRCEADPLVAPLAPPSTAPAARRPRSLAAPCPRELRRAAPPAARRRRCPRPSRRSASCDGLMVLHLCGAPPPPRSSSTHACAAGGLGGGDRRRVMPRPTVPSARRLGRQLGAERRARVQSGVPNQCTTRALVRRPSPPSKGEARMDVVEPPAHEAL